VAVVELAATPHPQVRTIAAAELSHRLAWRGVRLEFTRTPLAEAVALFNRHAAPGAPRLAVADSEVSALRVSGIFRADNAAGFVTLLESAFDVRADRTGAEIRLYGAP
jgi:transmembrane sensor